MAEDASRKKNIDKELDRLIQVSKQLYEQMQGMGVTWNEAEMIWLNLGSFIFSQGSKLSLQETTEKMRNCVEGWAQS